MLKYTEYDVLNATLTLYKLGFDVFDGSRLVPGHIIPYKQYLGYGFFINYDWRNCNVLMKNDTYYKINREFVKRILLDINLRIKYRI